MNVRTVRLRSEDVQQARQLMALMAEVFGETRAALSDAYLRKQLASDDFWVIAAYAGEQVIGGITAHTLPMTRSESFELFIYDLAVRADHQRRGIGRTLVETLRSQAAERGIFELFVAADNEDLHALDFYRALGGTAAPVTMFSFGE